jgi:hypothetical protein
MHHKENKGELLPIIPKLKSKFIIEDFDKKMAEIDKALGFNKKESRRRRALNNVDSSISEYTTIKSTTSFPLTTSRKNKLYDGNYAMLNELPSIWTYLRQLWQDHTARNITKKISPKEEKENIDKPQKETRTITPKSEKRIEKIQPSLTETTANVSPESFELNKVAQQRLVTLTHLKPTTFTKWTWSTGPTFTKTHSFGKMYINLRARLPVLHTETQTILVQGYNSDRKTKIPENKKKEIYIPKKC